MALSTFPIAQELWSFAFTAFGVIGVMPTQVTFCFHGEEHLAVIETSFGKQLLIASCIMWTIWREPNHRTFEDEEKSMQDINNSFLRSLFEYCATIVTYKNILHSNSAGGGGECHVTLLLIFWTI